MPTKRTSECQLPGNYTPNALLKYHSWDQRLLVFVVSQTHFMMAPGRCPFTTTICKCVEGSGIIIFTCQTAPQSTQNMTVKFCTHLDGQSRRIYRHFLYLIQLLVRDKSEIWPWSILSEGMYTAEGISAFFSARSSQESAPSTIASAY